MKDEIRNSKFALELMVGGESDGEDRLRSFAPACGKQAKDALRMTTS